MQKNLLFYKFTPVKDPHITMMWQKALCDSLNLKGRIIISQHGINGTISGELKNLKYYTRAMKESIMFAGINYKWTDGSHEDYPKLSVKVRKELVTLDPDAEFDVYDSTKGLSPKAWKEYIEKHPDVVVLDARNEYESDIGVFKTKNLIAPKIKTFKEIKPYLDKIPKDKPVLTYCTGDIRCEYLSAYMKHKGFDEVYHLDGGIVKYGQYYGDDGLWEGKCYMFDKRMSIGFTKDSRDIGICEHCGENTSNIINCSNKSCNKQTIICDKCEHNISICKKCSLIKV